jgi:hypothetical protein
MSKRRGREAEAIPFLGFFLAGSNEGGGASRLDAMRNGFFRLLDYTGVTVTVTVTATVT